MDAQHPRNHPRAVTAAELIAETRKWLRFPYRHQGRGPTHFDCAGLLIRVAEDLDLLEDTFARNYGRLPLPALVAKAREALIPIPTAEPGCVVLIQWPQEPHPGHVAICTGAHLIHAHSRSGAVVEHGYRRHWLDWTRGLFRIPGVIGG